MPIKKTKVVKTKNQSFSNKIDATVVASNIEDILVNFIPNYEENLLNTEKTLKKIVSILKDEAAEGDIVAETLKEDEKKIKQDEQKSFLNILGNKLTSSLKIFKDFSMKSLSKAWNIATTFISEQYKSLKMFVEEGFKTLTGILDQSLRTAQEALPMILSFLPFGAIIGKIVGGVLFGIPRILLKVIPKIISGLFNIGGIIGRALFVDLPKKLGGIIKDSLTTPSGLLMWALVFGFIFRKHLMQLFKTYIKPIWDTYVKPVVDQVWGKITSWFGNEKNIKWIRSFFPKQVLDVVDGIVAWWKNSETKSWVSALKEFVKSPIKVFQKWWSGENGAEKTIFGKIGESLTNWWKSEPEIKQWLEKTSVYLWEIMLPKLTDFIRESVGIIWQMVNPWSSTKKYNKSLEVVQELKDKGRIDEANILLEQAQAKLRTSGINEKLMKMLLTEGSNFYTTRQGTVSAEVRGLLQQQKIIQDNFNTSRQEYEEQYKVSSNNPMNATHLKNLKAEADRNEHALIQISKDIKEFNRKQEETNKKVDKILAGNDKNYPSIFNNVNVVPTPPPQQTTGLPSLDFGIGGYNRSFAGDY